MISIRNRLLITLLASLAAIFAIVATMNYYFTHDELTDMMDGSLKQMAISIAPAEFNTADYEASSKSSLEDEEDFLILVWEGKNMIYTSHPNINIPLQKEGFGYIYWQNNEESWHPEGVRYFQYHHKNKTILVGQSSSARQEMEHDIFIPFTLIMILLFPTVFYVIYKVTGYGLRPLTTVSSKVKERGAHNLKPINMASVPQEIKPLVQSLNQLFRRLDDSLNLQRTFIADAAHELRTPLTALKLQLEMLERSTNKEDREEVEAQLQESVERSIDLVQGLLLLARHETDTQAVDVVKINVSKVVKSVLQNLQPFAKEKQIDVTITQDENVHINGQEHNIFVMIENLIQNAILYTPKKGKVSVNVRSEGGEAIIAIADNGVGISTEDRKRVFDRFFRVDSNKQNGSGLGLSIIKNIVDYYHGEIRIEDGIENTGSTFIVKLPLAKK